MMHHKAYVFEHGAFERELRPSLEHALATGDSSRLVSFIHTNLSALRDPHEGLPLEPDWSAQLEAPDAHQYGDVALTKYYRPVEDIGLGPDWERLQELVAGSRLAVSPILGTTVGPQRNVFDPGKMGSYFQSAAMARRSYEHVVELAKPADVVKAIEMLEKASSTDSGLYVTF